MLFICYKCNKEFNDNPSAKRKFCSLSCRIRNPNFNQKEYMKLWKKQNIEKVREYNRNWRKKNPSSLSWYRKWYFKNGRKRSDGSFTIAPAKRTYTRYEKLRLGDRLGYQPTIKD